MHRQLVICRRQGGLAKLIQRRRKIAVLHPVQIRLPVFRPHANSKRLGLHSQPFRRQPGKRVAGAVADS